MGSFCCKTTDDYVRQHDRPTEALVSRGIDAESTKVSETELTGADRFLDVAQPSTPEHIERAHISLRERLGRRLRRREPARPSPQVLSDEEDIWTATKKRGNSLEGNPYAAAYDALSEYNNKSDSDVAQKLEKDKSE